MLHVVQEKCHIDDGRWNMFAMRWVTVSDCQTSAFSVVCMYTVIVNNTLHNFGYLQLTIQESVLCCLYRRSAVAPASPGG